MCLLKGTYFDFAYPLEMIAYPQGYAQPRLRIAGQNNSLLLKGSCDVLEDSYCSDCISGQQYCHIPEPVCWVQGQCIGNISHIEGQVSSQEKCLEICKQDSGFNTFIKLTFYFILFDNTWLVHINTGVKGECKQQHNRVGQQEVKHHTNI